jgi:hypothetical protein
MQTLATILDVDAPERLVDAHGGRMSIENNVGVGSTFFFALPR